MSADPTLIMRVDGVARLGGDNCYVTACDIIKGRYPHAHLLDASWSRPASGWQLHTTRWPRRLMSDDERALVRAASIITEHGATLPQTIAEELLDIIGRVTK